MYSSFDIAKKFLDFAERESLSLDPMKLLKLVYIAHGFYLGLYNKPLIYDRVEAWKYGPVIPNLYQVIKRFGFGPVQMDIIDLYAEKEVSEADTDFLETIWQQYKKFDGLQLSFLTHQEGSPWALTYDGHTYHKSIPNPIISKYYSEKLSASA